MRNRLFSNERGAVDVLGGITTTEELRCHSCGGTRGEHNCGGTLGDVTAMEVLWDVMAVDRGTRIGHSHGGTRGCDCCGCHSLQTTQLIRYFYQMYLLGKMDSRMRTGASIREIESITVVRKCVMIMWHSLWMVYFKPARHCFQYKKVISLLLQITPKTV